MPTLDRTIYHAKAAAKRTGKVQFVFRSYGGKEEYLFGQAESLSDHPRIVGQVSATEVPIYTRVP